MHSSNSNWVLPALYHRLYFSIPSGGDVELLITDTVGLEGAFADSTKERRFGEEEAFFDAVCPEGARGLLGPLLGLPPAKKKTKKAPGVRDATNAPWF